MRLSLKFPKPAGRVDLTTGGLVLGGVALIGGSVVAAVTLLAQPTAIGTHSEPGPPATATAATATSRPSVVLAADQVATLLVVDVSAGAGIAARAGDRVDVLGYFSRQVIGSESVTRLLLQDAPVLTVDRAGQSVALTLAVAHDEALLLQEAQAIGARPFVTLRALSVEPSTQGLPRTFSDTDLANRLVGLG